MWIWIFGFSISLFLTFYELKWSIVVSLLPLIIQSIVGLLELIFCLCKYFDKYNRDINIFDIIQTAYMWSITLSTLILIYTQLIDIITFDTFFILTLVSLTGLSLIYMIVGGSYNMFVNMKLRMRIANVFTFITTVTTYLSFYAVENGWSESWIPLIPFTASVLVETYIVYTLRQGTDDLTDDFSKKLATNRFYYALCIGTLFAVSIIHYIIDGIDLVIYLGASALYLVGIIIISTQKKNRMRIHFQCFKRAKWQELKGNEMFNDI